MKRLLFIYNPHAGKGLLKPKISDIVDIFVKAGYEVTIYPTQAYQDAYKKILEYHSEDYELIVCSGGDGTLDEVVTGMMKDVYKRQGRICSNGNSAVCDSIYYHSVLMSIYYSCI